MDATENLPHALNLSPEDWREWSLKNQLPSYVAKQILEWIYKKNCLDPVQFTNISKSFREKLLSAFNWELPKIDSMLHSKDGCQKYLLETHDHLFIEMVLMPSESRITLCISCQVGCRMGCTFCQTGKMGFKRNLSRSEILAQLIVANGQSPKRVTNVVFMGMGEPLDNYDAVVKAGLMMIDSEGFALSKSKVTISTSGLLPEIKKLGVDLPVRLAISLHTADEDKRSLMMPINRKYPLHQLKEVLLDYPSPSRYGITFEYVMIEGENDSLQDAKKLVHYLHGLKAKVNLIPINHFPGMDMTASKQDRLNSFQSYLSQRGIPAPIRYSRGQDISGGCGQLAAKRENEINCDPRALRASRKASRLNIRSLA